MKRTLMQMYVKGSAEALKLYRDAFNATVLCEYPNPDGSYMHAELDAYGQVLAVSEAPNGVTPGDNMQFCLHFEENEIDKVKHAYKVLRDRAKIVCPIGKCPYSECMFALVDRFGVYWCVFN